MNQAGRLLQVISLECDLLERIEELENQRGGGGEELRYLIRNSLDLSSIRNEQEKQNRLLIDILHRLEEVELTNIRLKLRARVEALRHDFNGAALQEIFIPKKVPDEVMKSYQEFVRIVSEDIEKAWEESDLSKLEELIVRAEGILRHTINPHLVSSTKKSV